MIRNRYLTKYIRDDLHEKMVFLGGPRQVGKTTLAKEIVAKELKHSYYSWDKISERRTALKGEWPSDHELIILDEFHKFPKWKSWIKGEYDTFKTKHKFLLTGSAHLNIYRKGGDSLQGRYHYYTLYPFSYSEVINNKIVIAPGKELTFSPSPIQSEIELLYEYGGFPEPLFKQDARFLRRWHNERIERFFKEDIRDLTLINDFGNLSLLAELLPQKVSSILSINSLAEDLQVHFKTISRWLDVFEQFYYCFRVSAFQTRKIASVRKEKKLYVWDWSEIKNEGARLENFIACHLLKFCSYLKEVEGWKVELFYLRDSTGRELDFLVCFDNNPWFAVETKTNEKNINPQTYYFNEKLKIPFTYQIVLTPDIDFIKKGIRIISLNKFLSGLM